MSEPINLNKARKAKALSEKQKRAAENRAKHGRTKAEKAAEVAESERASRALDAARKED